MPVYEYECSECDNVFEVQQKMSEDPVKSCPECGGDVRKLMSMSSFQLKGGGWYADGYSSASANTAGKSASSAAPACPSGGGCSGCPASTTSS